MASTTALFHNVTTKAQQSPSLAAAIWNTSVETHLLRFHHAALKTIGVRPWVDTGDLNGLQATAARLCSLYAYKASEVLIRDGLKVLQVLTRWWMISVPIFILSIPVIVYVVYQVYFHPLAKYPGPFLGKLTDARAAYYAWRGTLHYDMWECHQKYGQHIRYKPNYLLFDTVQACRDVYGHNKNTQKSQPYLAMVHNTPSTFTLTNKAEHAWKKRILSQNFSDAAIRSYEPELLNLIDRLCEVLSPQPSRSTIDRIVCKTLCSLPIDGATQICIEEEPPWSDPFNMSTWCDNLFFDLMTTTVFGECFDLIRSPWYRYVPEALSKSNERISILVQWQMLIWHRLDKKLFKSSVHGRKEFLRFVHNLVHHRTTRGSGTKDVFSSLLNASDPTTGKKLSQDEIVAESILMIVAGSDTSSTLLASMFFYLAKNPNAKDRLVQEVRSCFATKEEVRLGAKLNSCRYLSACISECLRMAPPVASAPFREISPGGAIVDGHFLAGGTNIGVGVYSIQHNPQYFPHPFEFQPERWLGVENKFGVNVTDAFVPFSMGPRACLGKALAVAEGTLATAYICWSLDFTLDENQKDIGGGTINGNHGRQRPDEYQLYDHITSAREGPWIRFRRRS